MKKHLMLLTAVIGACLMGGISTANATATLRLTSSDATTITITDGGAGDMSVATGAVNYNGTVGANWIVNVSTGLVYPISGYSSANGHMDLNSVNVSAGAGSLTLEFSEVGFDSLSAVQNWISRVGGTLGGGGAGSSFTFKVYAGIGLFSHDVLVTDVGTLTGSPFAATDGGIFGPSASHSLTIEVVLNHASMHTTSFDAETMKTPEGGSTVAMLGIALLGLGGVTAFRKQQARA